MSDSKLRLCNPYKTSLGSCFFNTSRRINLCEAGCCYELVSYCRLFGCDLIETEDTKQDIRADVCQNERIVIAVRSLLATATPDIPEEVIRWTDNLDNGIPFEEAYLFNVR